MSASVVVTSACAPAVDRAGAKKPMAVVMAGGAAAARMRRYAPCRRLRQTLYGETTLVEDKLTKRQLVLKRINVHALKENRVQASDNPVREHEVIQMLQKQGCHPNVVRYEPDAMFCHGGNIYVAMEYCNGGDLYDYTEAKPEGKLHELEALKLIYQIARGVQHLHDHGAAHRDLSLENILLHDGRPKLCDFGLSTFETSSKDVVGKLYYMAPEVVKGIDYDPACADIWSLGVLLFVMITGSPLIAEESPREATYRVLTKCGIGRILEMWGLRRAFSRLTVDLLARMLQMDASKRLDIDGVLRHPALRAYNNQRPIPDAEKP
ncbi:TPA: hypothetical protein N0F65_002982 [Lagenidium giganteum]|uniref:Protein kinase domain-containing protein n=1 Tax=Lagenidium giganteum TaxID=4803 RepID=A0AAV2YBJ1_9STRA|nr:TPA: hypothetical protein N0F65_002982 [Lagenidium giganteum]